MPNLYKFPIKKCGENKNLNKNSLAGCQYIPSREFRPHRNGYKPEHAEKLPKVETPKPPSWVQPTPPSLVPGQGGVISPPSQGRRGGKGTRPEGIQTQPTIQPNIQPTQQAPNSQNSPLLNPGQALKSIASSPVSEDIKFKANMASESYSWRRYYDGNLLVQTKNGKTTPAQRKIAEEFANGKLNQDFINAESNLRVDVKNSSFETGVLTLVDESVTPKKAYVVMHGRSAGLSSLEASEMLENENPKMSQAYKNLYEATKANSVKGAVDNLFHHPEGQFAHDEAQAVSIRDDTSVQRAASSTPFSADATPEIYPELGTNIDSVIADYGIENVHGIGYSNGGVKGHWVARVKKVPMTLFDPMMGATQTNDFVKGFDVPVEYVRTTGVSAMSPAHTIGEVLGGPGQNVKVTLVPQKKGVAYTDFMENHGVHEGDAMAETDATNLKTNVNNFVRNVSAGVISGVIADQFIKNTFPEAHKEIKLAGTSITAATLNKIFSPLFGAGAAPLAETMLPFYTSYEAMDKVSEGLKELGVNKEVADGTGAGTGVLAFSATQKASSAITQKITQKIAQKAATSMAAEGVEMTTSAVAEGLAEAGTATGAGSNPLSDALYAASAVASLVTVGEIVVNRIKDGSPYEYSMLHPYTSKHYDDLIGTDPEIRDLMYEFNQRQRDLKHVVHSRFVKFKKSNAQRIGELEQELKTKVETRVQEIAPEYVERGWEFKLIDTTHTAHEFDNLENYSYYPPVNEDGVEYYELIHDLKHEQEEKQINVAETDYYNRLLYAKNSNQMLSKDDEVMLDKFQQRIEDGWQPTKDYQEYKLEQNAIRLEQNAIQNFKDDVNKLGSQAISALDQSIMDYEKKTGTKLTKDENGKWTFVEQDKQEIWRDAPHSTIETQNQPSNVWSDITHPTTAHEHTPPAFNLGKFTDATPIAPLQGN